MAAYSSAGNGGRDTSTGAGWSNNANAGNIASALSTMQAGGYNTSDTQEWDKVTGGMTPAQFQTLPQAEQNKIVNTVQSMTDARAYAPSLFQNILGQIALTGSVAALTAGVGSSLGAALGGVNAAGNVSLSAGLGGGTLGNVGAGATLGLVGGTAGKVLTGQPITLKGEVGSALGGAAGGGLTSLAGGALNNATNGTIGNTLSTAAAGAGIGAARTALTGGNVGEGAFAGGVGGAVQGSGIGSPSSSGVVNGAANYAIGGATGLAAGALFGGGNAPSSGAVRMASDPGLAYGGGGGGGSNYIMSGAQNGAGPGGQGNSDNMATTDQSLASTILGAAPGLLQAGSTVAGSAAGTNALVNANNNAITTQQNTLGNIGNIWSNQQALGQGADTSLGSALGTNGQPANYSGFENMPGYQFAIQQGTQATQRQAAAMGSAYTPNTAAAIGQYVTGTAMGDYNTYISQLMGAAGLGTSANTALTGAQTNAGNQISTLQQNIGAAQQSNYNTMGAAANGLFTPNGAGTSLIGAASKYLNGGTGGGTGGMGPSMGAPAGGDVSGGVDPSTGVPYDIENPSYGSTPSMPTYDASNPLGGMYGTSPISSGGDWSSVTDTSFNPGNFNASGDSLWNSVTDTGGGGDALSFMGAGY